MLIYFGYVLILFDVMLTYFDIIFIFEEAGPYCARRGVGTSIFGPFQKNMYFHHLQRSSGLGDVTLGRTKSRQKRP